MWHVRLPGGRTKGPYSTVILKDKIEDGDIPFAANFKSDGSTHWVSLEEWLDMEENGFDFFGDALPEEESFSSAEDRDGGAPTMVQVDDFCGIHVCVGGNEWKCVGKSRRILSCITIRPSDGHFVGVEVQTRGEVSVSVLVVLDRNEPSHYLGRNRLSFDLKNTDFAIKALTYSTCMEDGKCLLYGVIGHNEKYPLWKTDSICKIEESGGFGVRPILASGVHDVEALASPHRALGPRKDVAFLFWSSSIGLHRVHWFGNNAIESVRVKRDKLETIMSRIGKGTKRRLSSLKFNQDGQLYGVAGDSLISFGTPNFGEGSPKQDVDRRSERPLNPRGAATIHKTPQSGNSMFQDDDYITNLKLRQSSPGSKERTEETKGDLDVHGNHDPVELRPARRRRHHRRHHHRRRHHHSAHTNWERESMAQNPRPIQVEEVPLPPPPPPSPPKEVAAPPGVPQTSPLRTARTPVFENTTNHLGQAPPGTGNLRNGRDPWQFVLAERERRLQAEAYAWQWMQHYYFAQMDIQRYQLERDRLDQQRALGAVVERMAQQQLALGGRASSFSPPRADDFDAHFFPGGASSNVHAYAHPRNVDAEGSSETSSVCSSNADTVHNSSAVPLRTEGVDVRQYSRRDSMVRNRMQRRNTNIGALISQEGPGSGVMGSTAHDSTTYADTFHDFSTNDWTAGRSDTFFLLGSGRHRGSISGGTLSTVPGQLYAYNVRSDNLEHVGSPIPGLRTICASTGKQCFGILNGSLIKINPNDGTYLHLAKLTLKDSKYTVDTVVITSLSFGMWLEKGEALYGVMAANDALYSDCIVCIDIKSGTCEVVAETHKTHVTALASPPLEGGPWGGTIFYFWVEEVGLFCMKWANRQFHVDAIIVGPKANVGVRSLLFNNRNELLGFGSHMWNIDPNRHVLVLEKSLPLATRGVAIL